MANLFFIAWHHLIATISSLRAILSHCGRVCLKADQEQHHAAFEDNEELIKLIQFKADDLERFLAHGDEMEA